MLGYHTPPGADTPQEQTPPGADTPQEQTHPPGADTHQSRPPRSRPLREQTSPPGAEHAGRYGQRAGGMHPTGMQTCIKYVSVPLQL